MKNYSNKEYIKFWGVRGSNPTPDKDKMQFGGDTSCVEIRTKNNDLIILDMGSGLRNLGAKIIADDSYSSKINIFLSHYHWDHIMGFFYFAPLYNEKFTVNIYGFNNEVRMEDLSKQLINKGFWPVEESMYKANINFIELEQSSNDLKTLDINDTKIFYSEHAHPGGANSFRIETGDKKIVYVTDCEHSNGELNKNVLNIAEECDILIHDSHFTVRDLPNHIGWGHSSWKQSIDIAIVSRVKQLVLFHYSPDYNDEKIKEIEINAQKKFINTIASFQGLSIGL
tara:strand:- start:84 stop:932 length:849 start_codon:yes stop_codon:yes gene_type:complete